MRRALLIGIDNYPSAPLNGCVADVQRVEPLLEQHENGDRNFDCKTLIAPKDGKPLTRALVKQAIDEHFSKEADAAVLHFSGHGLLTEWGGYLVTSDGARYDEGLSMLDLMLVANRSKIPEVTLFLDCCHSGALGEIAMSPQGEITLREGVAVLTASGRSEVSMEADGGGLFTTLLCDALGGQAADLFGNVTVPSIYAHVDPQLGAWDQRPRLRANLKRLTPLRRTQPPVALTLLRSLPELFASDTAEHQLYPSYEPSAGLKHAEHEKVFAALQQLCRAGLVEPVGEVHMYHAAIGSRSCRLTRRGQHCWHLAKKERI